MSFYFCLNFIKNLLAQHPNLQNSFEICVLKDYSPFNDVNDLLITFYCFRKIKCFRKWPITHQEFCLTTLQSVHCHPIQFIIFGYILSGELILQNSYCFLFDCCDIVHWSENIAWHHQQQHNNDKRWKIKIFHDKQNINTKCKYYQTSNISRNKSQHLNVSYPVFTQSFEARC